MAGARYFGLIQARMGSTRLPEKVMCDLAGRPLVWHIADRLRRVKSLSGVILATTLDPRNDPLVAFAEKQGWRVHRDPMEDDIAGRLQGAMTATQADAVVKVNADCPFVDPPNLQTMVDIFADKAADYVSNRIGSGYPDGMSAEMISAKAIAWCAENFSSAVDREFVCTRIMEDVERFRVVSMPKVGTFDCYNLCLDTREDYEVVSEVYARLYRPGACFGLDEIIALLKSDPSLDRRARFQQR